MTCYSLYCNCTFPSICSAGWPWVWLPLPTACTFPPISTLSYWLDLAWGEWLMRWMLSLILALPGLSQWKENLYTLHHWTLNALPPPQIVLLVSHVTREVGGLHKNSQTPLTAVSFRAYMRSLLSAHVSHLLFWPALYLLYHSYYGNSHVIKVIISLNFLGMRYHPCATFPGNPHSVV